MREVFTKTNVFSTSPESSIASDVSLSNSSSSLSGSIESLLLDDEMAGYAHEPEYTEEELKKIKQNDHNDTSDNSEDGLDNHNIRLENMHWCSCQSHCVILPMLKNVNVVKNTGNC